METRSTLAPEVQSSSTVEHTLSSSTEYPCQSNNITVCVTATSTSIQNVTATHTETVYQTITQNIEETEPLVQPSVATECLGETSTVTSFITAAEHSKGETHRATHTETVYQTITQNTEALVQSAVVTECLETSTVTSLITAAEHSIGETSVPAGSSEHVPLGTCSALLEIMSSSCHGEAASSTETTSVTSAGVSRVGLQDEVTSVASSETVPLETCSALLEIMSSSCHVHPASSTETTSVTYAGVSVGSQDDVTLCRTYNLTASNLESLNQIWSLLIGDLILDKRNLSKNIRSKSSAPDPRPSSHGMAFVAVLLVTVPCLVVILLDFRHIGRDLTRSFLDVKHSRVSKQCKTLNI